VSKRETLFDISIKSECRLDITYTSYDL